MSQSVGFVYPLELDAGARFALAAEYATSAHAFFEADEKTAYVTARDGSWYIIFAESAVDLAREMIQEDEDAPLAMRQAANALTFVYLQYNDFAVARELIRRVASFLCASGRECWFNSDYGRIMDCCEVSAMFEQNPQWDWRFLDTAGNS